MQLNLLFLIIIAILANGCQTSTLTMGDSTLKRTSLGYPLKLDALTYSSTSAVNTNGISQSQGQLTLKGYVSDQAQMAEAIASGVTKGVVAGMNPAK